MITSFTSCRKDDLSNDPDPKINYPSSDIVYDLFKEINKVPRPSWHEEKVADFLKQFAVSNNLDYKIDKSNNVVIKKSASKGSEKSPIIVLLCHMDMVCVAEDGKTFDPINDPIESYVDNGWIKAKGTSLGADNGIGMAMAMAVLQSKDIVHGPLECIFTTNEEDGMTGAANLSNDFLEGRLIINLDSEDYNTITVGSAAAYLQFTTFNFTKETAPDCNYFKLNIKGGAGGHSGVDINKGRASANKMIVEFLYGENQQYEVVLSDINGGEANNSIPVNMEAVVGVPSSNRDHFVAEFDNFAKKKKNLYKDTDPAIVFTITPIEKPNQIINKKVTDALLQSVNDMPFGVIKMSEVMPGAVETSNNTGVIKTNQSSFFISNYSRSFIDAKVKALGENIKNIFDVAGAQTEIIMFAPGWQSDLSSQFLKLTENSFVNTLGFVPTKVAMHFGLESGYFMEKFPGAEIVSIGPKIIEPHSITERVEIKTIDDIWKVFINMLYKLTE